MGGTTQVHAGFLLKGEEIWQVLPKKPGEPDLALFGTYKCREFTNDHWVKLIGQSFKAKVKISSGGVARILTSTLEVNPPLPGSAVPFSLKFSNSRGTSAYPIPDGEAEWTDSNRVVCCKRTYNKNVNFCGVCGAKLSAASTNNTRYVNQSYRLLSIFGSVQGSYDPVDTFGLRDVLRIPEKEIPMEWVQDEFYEIGEAIAESLGGVCSNVDHMKDWTFLVAPKAEGCPWSKDLWSDKENYVKLADVDAHRDAIEAMRAGLVKMGFKDPQFVFHPEWVE